VDVVVRNSAIWQTDVQATSAGVRRVLTSWGPDALTDHRERQEAEKEKTGEGWQDHGLVVPAQLGTPMEPDNLRRSWGRICKAAGLMECGSTTSATPASRSCSI
jgi:hypothetical protein